MRGERAEAANFKKSHDTRRYIALLVVRRHITHIRALRGWFYSRRARTCRGLRGLQALKHIAGARSTHAYTGTPPVGRRSLSPGHKRSTA